MGLDWNDLFAALAFAGIVEGILPFLSPARSKRLFAKLATMEEREMRIMGMLSMLVGAGVLYWARS